MVYGKNYRAVGWGEFLAKHGRKVRRNRENQPTKVRKTGDPSGPRSSRKRSVVVGRDEYERTLRDLTRLEHQMNRCRDLYDQIMAESESGLPQPAAERGIRELEADVAAARERLREMRHALGIPVKDQTAPIGTTEAANRLGVTSVRIRQLIEEGRLPAVRVGKRSFAINPHDLAKVGIRIRTGRPRGAKDRKPRKKA